MASIHSPFLQEINPRNHKIRGRISFSNRLRKLPLSRQYFSSDLSIATNDYSREALIGAGPIGSVFKALFPDGQVSFNVMLSFMLNFYKNVKNNVQNDWYDTVYSNVKLLYQFSNFFVCVGVISMTYLS